MTRLIRPPQIVTSKHGLTVWRQQSEFGAVYHVRAGEAPALFHTNRQAEALAWLAGYIAATNSPPTR